MCRLRSSVRLYSHNCCSILTCLLSENLKLYMANQHCKHIFFGAVGSPKYHSALELFTGQKDRITLVTGSIADEVIRTLGFHAISFHKVFRPGPASSGGATTMIKPALSEPSWRPIAPTVSHTTWERDFANTNCRVQARTPLSCQPGAAPMSTRLVRQRSHFLLRHLYRRKVAMVVCPSTWRRSGSISRYVSPHPWNSRHTKIAPSFKGFAWTSTYVDTASRRNASYRTAHRWLGKSTVFYSTKRSACHAPGEVDAAV